MIHYARMADNCGQLATTFNKQQIFRHQ